MIEEETAVVFNAEMSPPNITLICVQQTRVLEFCCQEEWDPSHIRMVLLSC